MEIWTPGSWAESGVETAWSEGGWAPCGEAVLFINKAGRRLCDGCVRWAEQSVRGIPGGALRRADQPPMVRLAAPVPRAFFDRAAAVAAARGVSVPDLIRAAVAEEIRRHEQETRFLGVEDSSKNVPM